MPKCKLVLESVGWGHKIACWRMEYNQQRLHSPLDYRTPAEFANDWREAALSYNLVDGKLGHVRLTISGLRSRVGLSQSVHGKRGPIHLHIHDSAAPHCLRFAMRSITFIDPLRDSNQNHLPFRARASSGTNNSNP